MGSVGPPFTRTHGAPGLLAPLVLCSPAYPAILQGLRVEAPMGAWGECMGCTGFTCKARRGGPCAVLPCIPGVVLRVHVGLQAEQGLLAVAEFAPEVHCPGIKLLRAQQNGRRCRDRATEVLLSL